MDSLFVPDFFKWILYFKIDLLEKKKHYGKKNVFLVCIQTVYKQSREEKTMPNR